MQTSHQRRRWPAESSFGHAQEFLSSAIWRAIQTTTTNDHAQQVGNAERDQTMSARLTNFAILDGDGRGGCGAGAALASAAGHPGGFPVLDQAITRCPGFGQGRIVAAQVHVEV
ncbi:hypothetical protein [Bradyrhizobium liaoningense]|uniref:hypothetical protein n=1 Tax=Bradyrhizobium liaoningense TaxID=43992 RepID=UPI001BA6A743|nr:hypothetical protein [Bradyrhizobium liaoningense]MBR0854038.1 hypothetical protein [Bradyrhizobium liaoningense]